ncbi:hypothetical protein [Thalassospira australica]|uniref:hypothetical protein n=1 Tax=Thalassospira australica TaxID=1528106 RepID=UPI003850F47D
MTEEVEQERPTLEGNEALYLWRQGRAAWNSWVDQHPGWDISFRGIDFSTERDSQGDLHFSGYHFGSGQVNFSKTTFGDGNVYFSNAEFGDSNLYFVSCTFGNGSLVFSNATFGNSNIYFSGTNFGDGIIYFSRTNFGDGDLVFSETNFGIGNVYFYESNFGNGKVEFRNTTVEGGNLYFIGATFGNGEINFSSSNLENSEVSFSETIFGDGRLDFSGASFKELFFNPKEIGSNHVVAQGVSIKSRAVFMLPPSAAALKHFELFGASFNGPLFLSGNLGIVPDIRATRSSHQIELSDLNVKLRRIWKWRSWPPKLSRIAEDQQDWARLRRLKEIAETNKDHQAALRFSADENRAKRWIETSWFGSVLDMAFSAFSDYGQNILRPFVALIILTAASMGLYKTLATETSAAGWEGWAQAALLSASNSLPFLPQSRDLREDALTALHGTTTTPDLWVNTLMITQGVLSFAFLFLIGLGLRNRFRL